MVLSPRHPLPAAVLPQPPFFFYKYIAINITSLHLDLPGNHPHHLPTPITISAFSLQISNHFLSPTELANLSAPSNEVLVKALYEALSSRDAHAVQSLLAPDLEWWFHGPPSHQFLMPLLTGATTSDSDTFQFNPQSIVAFGSLVLAEGCDPHRAISWVHAWTVSPDGIITQVREYFNTSVTVTRLGKSHPSDQIAPANLQHCQPLWESNLANLAGKSVPGLVLAL